MNAPGALRVFPFLGDPVDQARSPALYNALFARHAVPAQVVPLQVAPSDLPALVRALFSAGNVNALALTNPHKRAMFALVDRCDPLTRLGGAVNAVRRAADGALEGTMLDGVGMVHCMQQRGAPPAGRRILVVGAGRAGRAIAIELAHRGAACLALHDRLARPAAALGRQLQERFSVDVLLPTDAAPGGFDTVVNATPLGTRDSDPLPFDVSRLAPGAHVFDAVMRPGTTALLRACAERGIAAASGEDMLLAQIPAYLRFFGLDELARRVENESAAG